MPEPERKSVDDALREYEWKQKMISRSVVNLFRQFDDEISTLRRERDALLAVAGHDDLEIGLLLDEARTRCESMSRATRLAEEMVTALGVQVERLTMEVERLKLDAEQNAGKKDAS